MAKNLEISFLMDFYGNMLTDKQREVVEYYYNEDLSLAEIAQLSGITRQGVRDSIKRGEAILFELEEKLGLAKQYREMSSQVLAIRSRANDIKIYSEDPQVVRVMDEIMGLVDQVVD